MKEKLSSKTLKHAAVAGAGVCIGASYVLTSFLRRFALSRTFPMYRTERKNTDKPDPLGDFLRPGKEWIRKEASSVTLINRDGMKLNGLFLPSIQAGSTRYVSYATATATTAVSWACMPDTSGTEDIPCFFPMPEDTGTAKANTSVWDGRREKMCWSGLTFSAKRTPRPR